jgi:membrane fusion protein, multidrug efflux system
MNMPIEDSALGDTFALERVSIRAAVAGVIEERHVEAGTNVRKGQLLFVIADAAFRAKRDAERSALAGAQARFESARTNCDPNIDAARITVTAAKARVQAAVANLSLFRVYSPIDGRVSAVKVQLGDRVRPGGMGRDLSELATVEQLDPMGICAPVDSRVLDRAAHFGQLARAVYFSRPACCADQDCPNTGNVFFIDGKIDPNTSTLMVKARLPNSNHTLLPGATIGVTVTFGAVKNVVVVPEQTVFESNLGSTVYVVTKSGDAQAVNVKASFAHSGMRVIESGLESGQEVILDGFPLLRRGVKVRTERAFGWTSEGGIEPNSGESSASARSEDDSKSKANRHFNWRDPFLCSQASDPIISFSPRL